MLTDLGEKGRRLCYSEDGEPYVVYLRLYECSYCKDTVWRARSNAVCDSCGCMQSIAKSKRTPERVRKYLDKRK